MYFPFEAINLPWWGPFTRRSDQFKWPLQFQHSFAV